AGEPLYPPAWTQVANGLDQGGGEEVMWCYAPNAQADFRAKMAEKYGDIAVANNAWGTDYADFSALEVPKPNTVSGALWEDTLTWYYAVKREFMAEQVATFTAAMSDCGLGDRARILYLPGADFTDAQWASCVEQGSAIAQLRIGCDNRYAVELAAQTDCILQYTGINDVHSLRILREWMYENGYGAVPVLGENAGDAASASNVAGLAATVAEMHLCGFDYTHSRWLFEADGVTANDRFGVFTEAVASLRTHLQALDHTVSPDFAEDSAVAAPSGKVLRLDITFDKPESEALAFCFVTFAQPMLVIENGDTLEYDVRLSTDMAGLGAIDGSFVGGKTVRDSFGITDTLGVRAHPNADLSDYAYPNWFHRVIELGNSASAGARLLELQLAAHPEAADGAFSQCDVTVWYDNIVIKRNGEVIAELFIDGENWLDRSASTTHYAAATATCEDLVE
ncbi:MAG: beta-galactosidase, partial [Clostridia bacterium]|nr:beta-galactosidase [Clostridia bacterium]